MNRCVSQDRNVTTHYSPQAVVAALLVGRVHVLQGRGQLGVNVVAGALAALA